MGINKKKYDVVFSEHLSAELQIGKAGEHLVCCDLLQQGHNAFLADQGLPYDIIADISGILYRVQVKATLRPCTFGKVKNLYRFCLKSAKKGNRKIMPKDVDIIAFVALDIKKVAYFQCEKLITKGGYLITCIEFRDKDATYVGRVYSNGTKRSVNKNARFFQNYSKIIINGK